MKISVIVPIYNVGSYIFQCVNSIINQTYTNIEIILVIDGSTDDSAVTCHSLAKQDSRIIILEKENEGLVSARKAGLKIATGHYVLNVDGDDWISENCIEKLVSYSEKGQIDVVIPGYFREFVGNNEKISTSIKSGTYNRKEIESEIFPRMISNKAFFSHGISTFSWGKLFKKDLLYNLQTDVPNSITLGEDTVVTYPFIANSQSIAIVDEYLYFYRQRAKSMLKTTQEPISEINKITFMIRFLSKQLKKVSSFDFSNQVKDYLVALSIIRTGAYLDKNDFIEGIFNLDLSNKKIVLFSSGAFGQQIYKNMNESSHNVIGWIDDDCFESKALGLSVSSPKIIEELKPEIIIIATLDISYYKKTIHKLEKHIKNKCEVIFPTLQKPFIRKYSKILLNEN